MGIRADRVAACSLLAYRWASNFRLFAPPLVTHHSMEAAEGEDESVFEITDFTNATPWER